MSEKEVAYICGGILFSQGLPGGSVVKNLPVNAGDAGSIPESGGSPGEGNGNALWSSCLGDPVDRGAWRATAHRAAKESKTTYWLDNIVQPAEGRKSCHCDHRDGSWGKYAKWAVRQRQAVSILSKVPARYWAQNLILRDQLLIKEQGFIALHGLRCKFKGTSLRQAREFRMWSHLSPAGQAYSAQTPVSHVGSNRLRPAWPCYNGGASAEPRPSLMSCKRAQAPLGDRLRAVSGQASARCRFDAGSAEAKLVNQRAERFPGAGGTGNGRTTVKGKRLPSGRLTSSWELIA